MANNDNFIEYVIFRGGSSIELTLKECKEIYYYMQILYDCNEIKKILERDYKIADYTDDDIENIWESYDYDRTHNRMPNELLHEAVEYWVENIREVK